jgi:hypothetical protein
MSADLRARVISGFKLHGLSLRREAAKVLVDVLNPVSDGEVDIWLDKIIDSIQKQPCKSLHT